MKETKSITGWHAHVYFEPTQRRLAQELCEVARQLFDLQVGRLHDDPVGPHPVGSCQLSVSVQTFEKVIPWLTINRGALTVFVHAETGDAWLDHTDHVLWLGESQPLRLEVLKQTLARSP